jgi:hypothetical protein
VLRIRARDEQFDIWLDKHLWETEDKRPQVQREKISQGDE